MKKRIDPGYLISLLLSVVLAFVIGAVILAIAGFSPGKAYLAMLNGAFSSARHIGDLLEYAMVPVSYTHLDVYKRQPPR